MMNEGRVAYTARPDASTPERGIDVLASIYRRAIRRYEENHVKKETAHPGGPDDAEESKNDRTATAIIQKD